MFFYKSIETIINWIDLDKLKLTSYIRDLRQYELFWKQTKTNYNIQFSINFILKDEIEKKNKKNPSKHELAYQTHDLDHVS
jgi:transposase